MLKITYKQLTDELFTQGIQRLSFFREWESFEELLKAKEIFKKCREIQIMASKEWTKISKHHAEKNKDGSIKFLDDKGNYKIEEGQKKSFLLARATFDSKTFTVDVEPLKMSAVFKTKITPAELGAIESVIQMDKKTILKEGSK